MRELDEAWEELTLLLDIERLEEEEVKPKPRAAVKKGKKLRSKPSQEEIEAMRSAKKAQARGTQETGGIKQKSSGPATAVAGPLSGIAETSPRSETGFKTTKNTSNSRMC